jgi:ferredoxin
MCSMTVVDLDQGATMRIRVDHDRCHGHQMCAIAAPDLFGSDEIGNAVVLIEGDVPRELEPAAKRAEGNCPERAIEIRG